jgi:hypothetical protein
MAVRTLRMKAWSCERLIQGCKSNADAKDIINEDVELATAASVPHRHFAKGGSFAD